jgi:hypothetical protein
VRSFSAHFIAQKNGTYAKPFIVGSFASPSGTVYVCDRVFEDGLTIGSNVYFPIVESWGNIGASLSGFGEAFATPRTTVTLQNDPVFSDGRVRFSTKIPRFYRQLVAEIYFAFEHPDTHAIYLELALKGPCTDAEWTYSHATVEVTSEAEELMSRDVLRVANETWTGIPDAHVGRALPIMVNAADRIPAWIYGEDRSKLLIAEDIRPAVLNYEFGSRWWQGAEVNETETSLGITAPVP